MGGAPGGGGFPVEMQGLRTSDYDCEAAAGEECQGDHSGGVKGEAKMCRLWAPGFWLQDIFPGQIQQITVFLLAFRETVCYHG